VPSNFLRHEPCPDPDCGSRDALSVYDDGHAHCFSCNRTFNPFPPLSTSAMPQKNQKSSPLITGGKPKELGKRRLKEATCRKWKYYVVRFHRIGHPFDGALVHVANYCDPAGKPVAQKVRFPDKSFAWLGEKNPGLYGMHLWRDGGTMIVVTEGELDCLTMSQLNGLKWPVVSVPNGAAAARRDVCQNLEWLEKFDSVVFMFDQDEPGMDAARACAALLSPGKAKIATLPLNDPSEMVMAGKGAEAIDCMWGAKEWRPDEIVDGRDLWPLVSEEDDPGNVVPYPWEGLNRVIRGIRKGEITTICAGTGIGKSAVCREIAHWLITEQKQTIGYIALEESIRRSALGLMSIELNQPLHLTREGIDEETLRKAYEATVGSGRFYSYDHFGSLAADNLLHRIRYLVAGCGCGWLILDHISIVISGMDGGEERRLIDNLMTKLRSLVENLQFGLILVSHLKEAVGKPLEEGGKTKLNLLRGSRSIGHLSDLIIGLERDQQARSNKNRLLVRGLKDRFTGEGTGVMTYLDYDPTTGRLTEKLQEFETYFSAHDTTTTETPF